MPETTKTPLLGLNRDQLHELCNTLGVPERQVKMRVRQLWNWLYQRGAQDFNAMTTLSKDFRETLSGNCTIKRPEVVTEQISKDGTRKWLIRMGPGIEVETVFIPEENRGTLCVSSQVGCTLNCSFCHKRRPLLMPVTLSWK